MSEDLNADNSSATDDSTDSVNRRRFVKALGGVGGAAVFTAVASPATAKSNELSHQERLEAQKRAVRPYSSPSAAEQAVKEHGSEVMTLLESNSWLDTSEVSALNFNDLWCPDLSDYVNRSEGIFVHARSDGEEYTPRIEIAKEMADHKLWIFIKPEHEEGHAWINLDSSPEDEILQLVPGEYDYTPQIGKEYVMTEDASIGPHYFCQTQGMCEPRSCCTNPSCNGINEYRITCCVSSPCTTGPITGCCRHGACEDGAPCGHSCSDVSGC